MIKFLAMGKAGKIMTGTLIAGIVAFSLLWWKHDKAVSSLGSARERVSQLVGSLKESETSIKGVKKELAMRDRLLVERDVERKRVNEELNSLREALQNAINDNEKVAECWNVNLGAYADRLREFTKEAPNSD